MKTVFVLLAMLTVSVSGDTYKTYDSCGVNSIWHDHSFSDSTNFKPISDTKKIWFISWVSKTTGFFGYGKPIFKTYESCLDVCNWSNKGFPGIHHSPMWDVNKLKDMEAPTK